MKSIINIIILVALANVATAQSIVGKWKTIDDETGEEQSIVEIYKRDGEIFGKIIKLYREEGQNPDPICDECDEDDPRYNQKVIGMEIIKGLKKDGDEFAGGTVLKPDEGKIYKCKIWLDGDELKIRGYWGLFYRTQTWIKAE